MSIAGTSSSRSHTSGVATLYGRLATSVQRSPPASSAGQSALRGVGLDDRDVGEVGDDVAEHRHHAAVDLDGGDGRPGLGRAPASVSRGRRRSRPRGRRCRRRPARRSGERCWDRRRSSARGRVAVRGRIRRAVRGCGRVSGSRRDPGDLDRYRGVGEVGDLGEGLGGQHDVGLGLGPADRRDALHAAAVVEVGDRQRGVERHTLGMAAQRRIDRAAERGDSLAPTRGGAARRSGPASSRRARCCRRGSRRRRCRAGSSSSGACEPCTDVVASSSADGANVDRADAGPPRRWPIGSSPLSRLSRNAAGTAITVIANAKATRRRCA